MRLPTNHALRNKGDTLVEVLIAMAIVGAVLSGAYTSTRRSANATRTAQEYSEALKIAESQVEQIKVAAEKGSPNVFAAGNFCITGGALSAGCTNGSGVAYSTLTTHVANSEDFIVRVTWDGLSGSTNNVEIDYRIRK